jgi:hypothetical protein
MEGCKVHFDEWKSDISIRSVVTRSHYRDFSWLMRVIHSSIPGNEFNFLERWSQIVRRYRLVGRPFLVATDAPGLHRDHFRKVCVFKFGARRVRHLSNASQHECEWDGWIGDRRIACVCAFLDFVQLSCGDVTFNNCKCPPIFVTR